MYGIRIFILKMKVKKFDDLDENWLGNVSCQRAYVYKNWSIFNSLFAVHNRTFRDRRTHTHTQPAGITAFQLRWNGSNNGPAYWSQGSLTFMTLYTISVYTETSPTSGPWSDIDLYRAKSPAGVSITQHDCPTIASSGMQIVWVMLTSKVTDRRLLYFWNRKNLGSKRDVLALIWSFKSVC